jgi:hypothetical protein
LKCCYLDPDPPRQINNNENKLDPQQLYVFNMGQFFKVTGALVVSVRIAEAILVDLLIVG